MTDLRNRRIYLPAGQRQHDPRTLAAAGTRPLVLGHATPADYAEFLRQRVEANYFAAALLMPRAAPRSRFCSEAKAAGSSRSRTCATRSRVSYEMAAHRFTNLATHHLDIPVHFMKINRAGIIYKAYANDGVSFPADPTGAIEGQRVPALDRAAGVHARGLPVVPAVHRHGRGHVLLV